LFGFNPLSLANRYRILNFTTSAELSQKYLRYRPDRPSRCAVVLFLPAMNALAVWVSCVLLQGTGKSFVEEVAHRFKAW